MFDLAMVFLKQLFGVIPEFMALLISFKLVHYFAFGD